MDDEAEPTIGASVPGNKVGFSLPMGDRTPPPFGAPVVESIAGRLPSLGKEPQQKRGMYLIGAGVTLCILGAALLFIFAIMRIPPPQGPQVRSRQGSVENMHDFIQGQILEGDARPETGWHITKESVKTIGLVLSGMVFFIGATIVVSGFRRPEHPI